MENGNTQNRGEVVIYQSADGVAQIDVLLNNETVWLTADQMASLFQRDKSVISRHIQNIYTEGELSPNTTVAKFATVVKRGFRGEVEEEITYYNLDMIISVGYRVNFIQGVQFRQWATQRIHEYIVKGFTIDDERLKGKISFEAAKEYAENEYKKYKQCTLSPAEEDYMETIRALNATAKKKSAENKNKPQHT